jgi:hypothetical protein
MFRLFIAIAACLASSSAFAADCQIGNDLLADTLRPVSYMVAGPGLLPFIDDDATQPGCPQAGATCLSKVHLLHPGKTVVVTSIFGDYVCAAILSDAPERKLISGFLPKSALLTVTLSPEPEWNGIWKFGAAHEIVAKPSATGLIDLTGDAGATGQVDALVHPKKHFVAFTQTSDKGTMPYDPTQDGCSAQLWLLDDYLVAVDNQRCGDSFNGIYERATWPE